MTNTPNETNPIGDYRNWLIAAEQKSQYDFDKTVLTLSGGALGVSFVFLKDVVGPQPLASAGFLMFAWLAWAFSAFSILASFYLSHLALRRAIKQVDDGSIHDQKPGGKLSCYTSVLNASGGVLFLVAICSFTVFAGANLPIKGETNDSEKAAVSSRSSDSATATAATGAAGSKARGSGTSNGGVHSAAATPEASQTVSGSAIPSR